VKYSIDTSAILDGWVRYYPRDVFPGLWENLDALIEDSVLIATEEVLHELKKKDDSAYEYFKPREKMFIEVTDEIQPVVRQILTGHPKLIDERKNRSGADPFVIALALVEGDCTVVTGERPSRSENRPHIPDICEAYSVRWISLLELIREQRWVY
jgi:hypothetical protein